MLRVNEIFYSIQGESTLVGLPTAFIRLTGCPLRCQYCDTEYAFKKGDKYSIEQILEKISSYNTNYVTVTGGEPLAQKDCFPLLTQLCENYIVSLETSGAMDVSKVDPRVIKVLDLKTPGSLEANKNRFDNIEYLTPQDQVKFVICDHHDFQWSKKIIDQFKLLDRCHVLFSPSYGQCSSENLAHWILKDNLSVRMQIQLHKVIWGEEQGR